MFPASDDRWLAFARNRMWSAGCVRCLLTEAASFFFCAASVSVAFQAHVSGTLHKKGDVLTYLDMLSQLWFVHQEGAGGSTLPVRQERCSPPTSISAGTFCSRSNLHVLPRRAWSLL